MIAGEYTFPLRSLAPARSLLPHSLRGALICAIFISSFFRYPIRGGGGDDGVAVFLLGVSSLGPSCGPCSRFASMFIVHLCRSKQDGGVVSRLPACLVPRPVKSSAPLPVASFASLIRLVPHSLRSSRLASRRPSRSHIASPLVSFLVPFPSCPMCRTACLPSCGRAVLFSSFLRSPPHASVLVSS